LPLVVRSSGGSVRDALSVLGQLLAGAGKDGVTYEIAIQLLGYTDGALLDEAVDALAARDAATLFKTVDRVIESGHDPRRFTQDFLERLRDLVIVNAVEDGANHILRELPEDQLARMRNQATHIGTGTLIRDADIMADGLTQMRGATAPRLILELICGQMLLPGNDDAGLIARVERLEKASSLVVHNPAPAQTAPAAQERPVTAPKVSAPKAAAPKEEVKAAPVKEEVKAAPVQSGPIDISALRRLWPEVIENVKKKRRLTWSLLSASAQLISVDDKVITLGIVNPGAKESFLRSESDVLVRQAFLEVCGVDRKIEVVVDAAVNEPVHERTTESPSDAEQLTGHALLMRELGAQVIAESGE